LSENGRPGDDFVKSEAEIRRLVAHYGEQIFRGDVVVKNNVAINPAVPLIEIVAVCAIDAGHFGFERLRRCHERNRQAPVHHASANPIIARRSQGAMGAGRKQKVGFVHDKQPRYNLLFREVERELLPLAREENLAVIPFNPLAGGLLTGKYRHDKTPAKGRFSAENGQFGAIYQARYWHEREFETIARLREIAKERGEPLAKLSVAWVLAHPAVTSAILGASNLEQLTETLSAADPSLGAELKARLNEVTVEYRRGMRSAKALSAQDEVSRI
jgi:aryl-alcohol dehydrogenase-like predicted oxidoreductase